MLRADVAFRTAKSRKLKKLHESSEWLLMNPQQQRIADKNAVKPLEAKREKRKRGDELEWRFKTETGRIDSDEDDEQTDCKKVRTDFKTVGEELIMFDDNDEDWSDCEGQEDWALMGEEVINIRQRYERKHDILVKTLGVKAQRREREYEKYKERRLAEVMDEEGEPMETD